MKVPRRPSSRRATPPVLTPVPLKSGRARILLVDDHPLMRRGIRMLIEQHSRHEVCAEAESAPQALALLRQHAPTMAIVDISLNSTNGIELIKNMRPQDPALRILVLSMHDEELFGERSLRAGAAGYLMKGEAEAKLIAAIEQVHQGENYVSDRLKARMLTRFADQGKGPVSLIDTLSDREMEVFQLIGEGYGTRAIALQLKLSGKTIDSYREHLKLKLNVTSGSDLLRHAVQWTKGQTLSY